MTQNKISNNNKEQDDALIQWLIDAEQILDDEEDKYVENKNLKELYSYYESSHKELNEMKDYLSLNPDSTIQEYIKVANHDGSDIIRLIQNWIFDKTNKILN